MAIAILDHRFILQKHGKNELLYFESANQDLTNSTYQYFGFISSSGGWVVQRFHIIASAVIYEYYSGKTRTDYDALWNANGVYIGTLTFTTFDKIAIL